MPIKQVNSRINTRLIYNSLRDIPEKKIYYLIKNNYRFLVVLLHQILTHEKFKTSISIDATGISIDNFWTNIPHHAR